uniref:Uncharacterized protein n=1 Tax=Rhizophora mucronata TaxID=61149 RepID=A0A2P2PQ42_RHIMU
MIFECKDELFFRCASRSASSFTSPNGWGWLKLMDPKVRPCIL